MYTIKITNENLSLILCNKHTTVSDTIYN